MIPTGAFDSSSGPPPSGARGVALVTGGTDGIGKAIAKGLVAQGATVIIVGRDESKGEATAMELRRMGRRDSVEFVQTDLSSMRNVLKLADTISSRWPSLDYLVLCAGIVKGRFSVTEEGIETNFAVNYLARFTLTQALLPNLMAAGSGPDAKILIIGGAVQNGKIHFENVNLAHRFNTLRVVSQFCQANDLFVMELARRIGAAASSRNVAVNELKVGVVRTAIRRQFPLWMKVVVPFLDPFLAISPEEIARSAVRILLGSEFAQTSGSLYRQIRSFKKLGASARASSSGEQGRLWDLSERLVAQALGRPLPLSI